MKRIYNILLAVIMIISLSTLTMKVYSLLTDTKIKGPNLLKYELGDLEYTLVGGLQQNYLYPGKNIVIAPYKLQNSSTINTELRIKLNFYIYNEDSEQYEIFIIENYVEEDGYDFNLDEEWIFNNIDGFYYYDGIVAANQTIDIFSILILDGHIVRNDFANKQIKLEIVVNTKQKDNVNWEQLEPKFN